MNEQIKAGADIHAGDGGYSEGTQEDYEKFVKVRNQSLLKARIREFEKQSGLEIFGLGARREIWEAALEKYAELIVRECANQVDWILAEGGKTQGDLIKEHFGVKE